MNRSILTCPLVALSVMAGAIATTASQASAEPPLPFSSTEEEVLIYNCESGAVLIEPLRTIESGRDFYNDGVLTRTVAHVAFDGVITNQMTGERFRDSENFSFEIDYVANTVTVRGQWLQLHSLDGGPVLLLDAGSITADLDTGDRTRGSAKHPSLSPNLYMHDAEILCKAVGA